MRYPIPAGEHQVEEEILRSRFITTAVPATTVEEAQAFIARMRETYPDATHNCWAYLVGPPGSSARVGMSDDGEPHGTAGRPMLNVLSHCGVGDIACVVTRYYGGTKLGKGGLVRAYSGGVQLVLQDLPTKEKVDYLRLEMVVPYNYVTLIRKAMERLEIVCVSENYETDVTYLLDIPEESRDIFIQEIDNLTAGEALWDLEP